MFLPKMLSLKSAFTRVACLTLGATALAHPGKICAQSFDSAAQTNGSPYISTTAELQAAADQVAGERQEVLKEDLKLQQFVADNLDELQLAAQAADVEVRAEQKLQADVTAGRVAAADLAADQRVLDQKQQATLSEISGLDGRLQAGHVSLQRLLQAQEIAAAIDKTNNISDVGASLFVAQQLQTSVQFTRALIDQRQVTLAAQQKALAAEEATAETICLKLQP